jgi:hypothetical protein
MKFIYSLSPFLLLFGLFFNACKSQAPNNASLSNANVYLNFADSNEGAKLIITDNSDDFFVNISALDIAIQMKSNKTYSNKTEAVESFKAFLKSQTLDFNDKEKKYVNRIFDEVKASINKLNPNLLPSINLVKIKTDHYGKDVFYTRENAIFIPENVLNDETPQNLHNVMLHEIYHVLSRNDADFKSQTYDLIGFRKIDGNVILDPKLAERLLSNPDGARMDYYIELEHENNKVDAIPLIISNEKQYLGSKSSLFSYLKFDLYELKKDTDGNFNVLCDNEVNTTLALEYMPTFFEKIKDNTQYIIHPDEVMADNFMLALTVYNTDEYNSLSAEGKKLIENLRTLLSNYSPN